MKNQDNGNAQLNSVRNEFNDRVESKLFLGRTKKFLGQGQEDLEVFKYIFNYCNRLKGYAFCMLLYYIYCKLLSITLYHGK